MNSLEIVNTTSTPTISFNAATGQLMMEGESYPENSFEFFKPLLDWLASFLEQSTLPVKFDIKLTYMNTSSIKSLMDLLDVLEEAHAKNREITVSWFYDRDNERALEMAEDFREEVTLPFFIVPTSVE